MKKNNPSVNYPYQLHEVDIHNGIRMAYMDEGRGETTLLFIHGLANYAPVWKYQMEAHTSKYRCIAIDLPGNGLSSSGDYPYTMVFYAECVRLLLDKLNLSQVVLCGHSMGGQIACMVALRYPHLVSRLILIAPAGFERFSATDVLWMQTLMRVGDFLYSDEFHLESAIKDSFSTIHADIPRIVSDLKLLMNHRQVGQWRQMALQSIQGMLNEQIHAFLPDITQPVLVIFGDNDRLIPNPLLHPTLSVHKLVKHAQAVIPVVQSHVIAGAGHFVHIEQHRAVTEYMQQFLKEIWN